MKTATLAATFAASCLVLLASSARAATFSYRVAAYKQWTNQNANQCSIPESFVKHVAGLGYNYIWLDINLGLYLNSSTAPNCPASVGDWNTDGTINTSSQRRYKSYLKKSILTAAKYGLKIIPGIGLGNTWDTAWYLTNTKVTLPNNGCNNGIEQPNGTCIDIDPNNKSRHFDMTSFAPEPNGIDKSFGSYLAETKLAFDEARSSNSAVGTAEFFHVSFDELFYWDVTQGPKRTLRLAVGNKPGTDRNLIVKNHDTITHDWEQAYYKTIADKISRVASAVKAKLGSNARTILWADMFDPEANGDTVPAYPVYAWTPSGDIILKTKQVLARTELSSISSSVVMSPWEYGIRDANRPAYNYLNALLYFSSKGYKTIFNNSLQEDSEANIQRGFAAIDAYIKASADSRLSSSVIGYSSDYYPDVKPVDSFTDWMEIMDHPNQRIYGYTGTHAGAPVAYQGPTCDLYLGANQSGTKISLLPGAYTLGRLKTMGMTNDNSVSSIKVPAGYMVIAYDGDGYTGTFATITADSNMASLPTGNFDKKLTSVIVYPPRDLAVIQDSQGLVNAFTRGVDNGLWTLKQAVPNGYWSRPWTSLGGTIRGNIAAVKNADGRLEVFAKTSNGALQHTYQLAVNGAWSPWQSMDKLVDGDVGAELNSNGTVDVFAKGLNDNQLWHIRQSPGSASGWGTWASLGGTIDGNLAVARNADGRLEVFSGGANNVIWHVWQPVPSSDTWSAWASLGGAAQSNIAVSKNHSGSLEVSSKLNDTSIGYIYQANVAGGWWSWAYQSCAPSGGNVALALSGYGPSKDELVLFHRSLTTKRSWNLWGVNENGPDSHAWQSFYDLGGPLGDAFVIANNQLGYLEAFSRGVDGVTIWHNWNINGTWSGWEVL